MSAATPRQSDIAYTALRQAILTLELPPGHLLSEADLMVRHGVGRTPLREALQRLAHEGLVTIVPRRGTQVAPVRPEDVRQVLEVRGELEALAARLAAQRATQDQIDEMRGLLAESHGRGAEFAVFFDQEMHRLIAEATANESLVATLARLYGQSVRLLYLVSFERESIEAMRAGFGAVVEAIAGGDLRSAEEAMRQHIWNPSHSNVQKPDRPMQ